MPDIHNSSGDGSSSSRSSHSGCDGSTCDRGQPGHMAEGSACNEEHFGGVTGKTGESDEEGSSEAGNDQDGSDEGREKSDASDASDSEPDAPNDGTHRPGPRQQAVQHNTGQQQRPPNSERQLFVCYATRHLAPGSELTWNYCSHAHDAGEWCDAKQGALKFGLRVLEFDQG